MKNNPRIMSCMKMGIERTIKEKVPEVYCVGDRVEARGILEAVREGYDVAKGI